MVAKAGGETEADAEIEAEASLSYTNIMHNARHCCGKASKIRVRGVSHSTVDVFGYF